MGTTVPVLYLPNAWLPEIQTTLLRIHNKHLQIPLTAMAAGALILAPSPIFSPSSRCTIIPKTVRFAVRASSQNPDASASVKSKEGEEKQQGSLTFAPPPNFKAPEPKRFGVRPDKTWDILGASLALFFRFGTGGFASG